MFYQTKPATLVLGISRTEIIFIFYISSILCSVFLIQSNLFSTVSLVSTTRRYLYLVEFFIIITSTLFVAAKGATSFLATISNDSLL